MAFGDFKDLSRRIASDKILPEKAFDIAKNPKYDGYKRGLASVIYNLFDKKTSGGAIKNKIMSNKEIAEEIVEELHKPIIRKFEKQKVNSSFVDIIWSADLADMQLLSKRNKGIRFVFCFIDIFSKHTWVISLKDKRGIAVTNSFQKILNESNRKPCKMWVDKGSEFYNRSMKSCLQDDNIEMYLTHNEEKSVFF